MRSLKVMLLVVAIALAPLGVGVLAMKQRERVQVEQDRALESEAGAAAARLRDTVAETRAAVLITAHNPVFRDFYRLGRPRYRTIVSQGRLMDRVNGALLYVTQLYPGSLVQASFVDGAGAENARIVRGSREAPHLLADDVSEAPFFRPALALRPGQVLESRPHLSRDAGEWVISYSTRVPLRSGSALVHVEQRLESLRRVLASDRARFEIAVVERSTGRVILDSRTPQLTGSALGLPGDRRFETVDGGEGVHTQHGSRLVVERLDRAVGSQNDWEVVAVSPRAGAAGLLGTGSLPILLALAAVLAVGAAMSRRWTRTSLDALTDPLTGLGNRRKLVADLERRLAETRYGRQLVVLMCDLDGFKLYNDAFGHPAGDALLARLGRRLAAAVGPSGAAYRLGGDEFCVVAAVDAASVDAVVAATLAALSERGEGFSVGCSYGFVLVPRDESDITSALRVADERLYATKRSGRRSAARQTADALLQALRERHPELAPHLHGVGDLVAAVAERLGLPGDEIDGIRQAAELHDVGKMAIPDAILSKPGPLDPDEWSFVREHTLIGERIVAAAPALAPVARLVRASHERWDGTGYPDGLAGEAIPLGSRIIAVCDAFDAMIGPRPYRLGMSEETAFEELRRCAGTQFDAEVVAVFLDLYAELGGREPAYGRLDTR